MVVGAPDVACLVGQLLNIMGLNIPVLGWVLAPLRPEDAADQSVPLTEGLTFKQ